MSIAELVPETEPTAANLDTVRIAASTLRNTGLHIAQTVATTALRLATYLVVARALTPDAMGQYSYIMWAAAVMAELTQLGLPTTTVKLIGEWLGRGDKARAARLGRRVLRIQAVVALVICTIGITLLDLTAAHTSLAAIAFLLLLAVSDTFQATFVAMLQGAQRFRCVLWVSTAGALLQFATVVMTARLHGGLTAMLVGVSIAHAVTLLVTAKQVPSQFAEATAPPAQPSEPQTSTTAFLISYIILLEIICDRSAVFFLRRYSTLAEIAFFSIGFTLMTRAFGIGSALTGALMPAACNARGRAGDAMVSKVYVAAMKYLQIVMVPLCVFGSVLIAPAIRTLYGDVYGAAIPVAQILFLCPLLAAVDDVAFPTICALDGLRNTWLALTAAAGFNIAASFWVISRYSAVGAALIYLITQILEAAIMLYYAGRITKTPVLPLDVLKPLAAGALSVIPAALAVSFAASFAVLTIATCAGIVLYVMALNWSGLIGRAEIRSVRAALEARA